MKNIFQQKQINIGKLDYIRSQATNKSKYKLQNGKQLHKKQNNSFLVKGLETSFPEVKQETDVLSPPHSLDQDRKPFKKLLAANRGEIAIRIFRAAQELGIQTVAVYSMQDRFSVHRFEAQEAYPISDEANDNPVACYLDVEKIIQVAKDCGADCIHPGYGFLSENEVFASRCEEEGIAFIGPQPKILKDLGDKTIARLRATEAGVSIIPGGNEALTDYTQADDFAQKYQYPVILKAAMGGGGRGMRVVQKKSELEAQFKSASNEALKAFGDGRLFIEKFIEQPRHIEIQILADKYGNVLHFYERDCSVQRRHQKVVEIAPAPNLDESIKQALYSDAMKIAKSVQYRCAGTVEFIVDQNGQHYFLEVNPRIQVEHTITEEITSIDLVQSQILVTAGYSLADLGYKSQEDVPPPRGYSIQCRVTSEDPEQNFFPATGKLVAYRIPGGPGIRLESAVTTGNVITQHYDSLLCKIISSAPTFQRACVRMLRALEETRIRGIKTNIPFLSNVLRHKEFVRGIITTKFIEDNHDELLDYGFDTDYNMALQLAQYLGDLIVNGSPHAPKSFAGVVPPSLVPPKPQLSKEVMSKPLTGWRDIYIKQGPEAWAKAIRGHQGLLLTDTTMRDAHQSLLATRMRTIDMLNIAPETARIFQNCASLEMWGGATFDVALRFLDECPWKRLELLREKIPNIPFQMLFRGANAVGYTVYPDNVVNEFVKEAKKTGVDIFRIFDSLNYIDNLRFGIDSVRAVDGIIEGTVCYTGDVGSKNEKMYTLDYYMDLIEKLVEHGIHSLAIKDMAGLLKPYSARLLISAIRKKYPELPIHVHTHDTSGVGVATYLACAESGADIVDTALDSLAGLTSQPNMGAIVHSFNGGNLDTGVNPDEMQLLATYWEAVRSQYFIYESNLKSNAADVYYHEMPGGQYTNLKYQAGTMGLGDMWEQVKVAYAVANKSLGNIVKVTPSSKMVGDLAQLMVANKIFSEEQLLEKAPNLSFPDSLIEYFQGKLGQPPFGFPEKLRSIVVRDKPIVKGRPGQDLEHMDLDFLQNRLKEKHGKNNIKWRDVVSSTLYPKVFDDYMNKQKQYGSNLALLPSRAYFWPLDEDEEVDIKHGLYIKFKAKGELQPSGKRDVFFEVNGIPRLVQIEDKAAKASGAKQYHEKADSSDLGQIGAPLSGSVVGINVKNGDKVKAGDNLMTLSAMKMETSVVATCDGQITQIAVQNNDAIETGDLLVRITTESDEKKFQRSFTMDKDIEKEIEI